VLSIATQTVQEQPEVFNEGVREMYTEFRSDESWRSDKSWEELTTMTPSRGLNSREVGQRNQCRAA